MCINIEALSSLILKYKCAVADLCDHLYFAPIVTAIRGKRAERRTDVVCPPVRLTSSLPLGRACRLAGSLSAWSRKFCAHCVKQKVHSTARRIFLLRAESDQPPNQGDHENRTPLAMANIISDESLTSDSLHNVFIIPFEFTTVEFCATFTVIR